MEARKDLESIMPFLPLVFRSLTVFWPSQVEAALRNLSEGPDVSNVNSGRILALAITDMRESLGFRRLHQSVSFGFSLFFDELLNRKNAENWFRDVLPKLADLLLRLPTLLEIHYQLADNSSMETGLRLLNSQQPGLILLNQELIAALLVCALFCLFPSDNRHFNLLPPINFDNLFRHLYESMDLSQEHKIKCILHYFEKICLEMPRGSVSYERKVLPWKNSEFNIAYPEAGFWSKSTASLSHFEVISSGLIEDQSMEALEVDFANKYIGGGALSRGCVQEEIRFMINPELILSLLFLPAMDDNEAIEIVGAERFSSYTGYGSSFRFAGNHSDKKSMDIMGRRHTRIIAIDALCLPGERQYMAASLLRETNKAFCGFSDHSRTGLNQTLDMGNHCVPTSSDRASADGFTDPSRTSVTTEDPSSSVQAEDPPNDLQMKGSKSFECEIGIATGNWGCGAFGGDPQVKAVIQWLAASQANRPFILYHTFGLNKLEKLEAVIEWICTHGWSVGDVWNILVEFCVERLNGETSDHLFKWLLPSLDVSLSEPH